MRSIILAAVALAGLAALPKPADAAPNAGPVAAALPALVAPSDVQTVQYYGYRHREWRREQWRRRQARRYYRDRYYR